MDNSPFTARAKIDPSRFAKLTDHLELGLVQLNEVSGSTNAELAQLATTGQAGHLSVYFSEHQQAGKGRLGRSWVTPLGSSITVSVLIVPGVSVPSEALSWYTMIAAVAWSRATEHITGVPVRIKWPNDLLAGEFKICGILAQMVPVDGGYGVVIGTGMNVDQSQDELPVPTATSLRLASSQPVDRTELLAQYLKELVALDRSFRLVGGSVHVPLPGFEAQSLHQMISHKLATLGNLVRVEFPDNSTLEATAVALGADGSLVLEDSTGRRQEVLAGDVHHVRRADGKYA